jgi:hypothetical protein
MACRGRPLTKRWSWRRPNGCRRRSRPGG